MTAMTWIAWSEIGIASSGLILLASFLHRRDKRRRARAARLSRSFDAAEEAVLDRDFPRWRDLPSGLRQRHAGVTRVLMEEKNFEACGGLPEVTPEMRLLISAQAALTLIGRGDSAFLPRLRSILVYPGAFRDPGRRRFGIHDEQRGTLYGESWETGSVVLSWDNVVAGGRGRDDGMNVVLHEFTHQLDQENGLADGVPRLGSDAHYARWREVMNRHYEQLVEDSKSRDPEPLLDPYGATHPCEFFAVATESFFEDSLDLEEEHPELYDELSAYYGLDPARWAPPS